MSSEAMVLRGPMKEIVEEVAHYVFCTSFSASLLQVFQQLKLKIPLQLRLAKAARLKGAQVKVALIKSFYSDRASTRIK